MKSVEHLQYPLDPYRVDIGDHAQSCEFESVVDCQAEDSLRAHLLEKAALTFSECEDQENAKYLAATLSDPPGKFGLHNTLASSQYMRDVRICVAGAVWELVDKVGADNVRAFTIVPRTWQFTPDELSGVDPGKLIKALRAALYLKGAKLASGWIIAFIHAEFDSIAGVFRFHVHGLVHGEMVEVIDHLRDLPNYSTQQYLEDGSPSPIVRSVRVSRKGLTNLPSPITYLLQSFWPERALIISDDGTRIRARTKGRIREPMHSKALLWLDRQRLPDLTLMVGLRVTTEGLKTKRVS